MGDGKIIESSSGIEQIEVEHEEQGRSGNKT
jgi:hypothetical protein